MHIAIVEDDKKYIQELTQNLKQFSTEFNTQITIDIFHNGAELIGNYKPLYDAIFLDIEMPVMNGLETAKAIREMDHSVILMFITNLAQYAVKGYEVNAIDYVLKPIHYSSFSIKMQRVIREVRANTKESIMIDTNDGETLRLPLQKIFFIEVMGHTLSYHTANHVYSERSTRTMKSLTADLKKYGFSRCNNSFLINLFYLDKIGKDYCIVNGEQLPISRSRKKTFTQDAKKYTEDRFFS